MRKLSKKEIEENYRARIESERPNIYASEEERIATEKIIAERQKEIEEYKKKHDALKHTKQILDVLFNL